MSAGELTAVLLSRIEDAGLNASAPPQQRWLDGWLVRVCPGKAKRARCINALADGRVPFDQRLMLARAVYEEARLPLIFRITPFTTPSTLEKSLTSAGFHALDDTRVMVLPSLPGSARAPAGGGHELQPLPPAEFAHVVGAMRGSPLTQREAHAQRLLASPLPGCAFVLQIDGEPAACGQFVREGELVGLYDVFTAPAHRGQGLAHGLCSEMLRRAGEQGARVAYLQVDADNGPARAIYHRLGFSDAYGYHYLAEDPDAA